MLDCYPTPPPSQTDTLPPTPRSSIKIAQERLQKKIYFFPEHCSALVTFNSWVNHREQFPSPLKQNPGFAFVI